jgi:hypothetical protein
LLKATGGCGDADDAEEVSILEAAAKAKALSVAGWLAALAAVASAAPTVLAD